MSIKTKKAMYDGELHIGKAVISCAVLEDGTRVLSQRGFAKALGASKPGSMTRRAAGHLPVFLAAKNLKPFVDDELTAAAKPIPYQPKAGGGKALGVNAEALPKICEVWLKARDENALTKSQLHLAEGADLLIRGLAHVGIIALVDEATGFQDDRTKKALAEILEQYLAKELQKWVKTFPNEYYKEMFRLRGWPYNEKSTKRAPLVGKLTNNIVYDRLAPTIRTELEKKNPKLPSGKRKHKHFQHLSENSGHPKLREHLASVTTLMKVASNWRKFMDMLNRALPKYGNLPLIDYAEKKAKAKDTASL